MIRNVHSLQLKNGLKILYIPHKVKSVTICLRGLAGSNFEQNDQIGCAHLLEHLTILAADNNIKQKIINKGGRITGTTSRDDVAFLVKVLTPSFRVALSFLANIFTKKLYTQEQLSLVKNIVKQEILQNKENTTTYISRLSYKGLFPNSRFCIFNTGDIEDLENINIDVLTKFMDKYYNPNNFVISICGDLNKRDVFQSVKKEFNKFNYKNTSPKLKHKKTKDFMLSIEKRVGVTQLHLRLDYYGYTSSNANRYAAYLLAIIVKNRLLSAVSKNKKLSTYTIETGSFSTYSYGLFGIYLVIDKKSLKDYLLTITRIQKELVHELIQNHELVILRNKVNADFIFTLEKTSLKADFYAELYLYNMPTKSHIEELNSYKQCSASDIRKTAKIIFNQKPKITVINDLMEKNNFMKIYNSILDSNKIL